MCKKKLFKEPLNTKYAQVSAIQLLFKFCLRVHPRKKTKKCIVFCKGSTSLSPKVYCVCSPNQKFALVCLSILSASFNIGFAHFCIAMLSENPAYFFRAKISVWYYLAYHLSENFAPEFFTYYMLCILGISMQIFLIYLNKSLVITEIG